MRWLQRETRNFDAATGRSGGGGAGASEPVLRVDNLTKSFRVRGLMGAPRAVSAVTDVSFSIDAGETLGLVGESGCGKSTLARTILGLYRPDHGAVTLLGADLSDLSRRELRPHRAQMQVVFQDPYASLNPRMKVHDVVAEPLRIHGQYRPGRVTELLELVGLTPEMGIRRPAELSGGQRQRLGIARALALRPKLLVLDEPVSALDVSIQAQVINLLKQLQMEFGFAYLFVAHDLSVVRHISDRVAVMYLGRIVETGSREQVFRSPAHPYTRSLLSAVPKPDPIGRNERHRVILQGELPDPAAPPSGCSFRTRCPWARDTCAATEPALQERGERHTSVACHFASESRPMSA